MSELEPPSESIADDPDAIAAALGSEGSYPATVWDVLAAGPPPPNVDIAAWWFRIEHGRLPRAGELDDGIVIAEWTQDE